MKIILASSSPRRKQILADAGFHVEVLKIDVEETYGNAISSKDVPLFLAEKKMQEALLHCNRDTTIITADTIVLLENEIIGKPLNETEAINILEKLSGKMHEVISGVCIYRNGSVIKIESSTQVFMQSLNSDEIQYYISTYKPFDKAGAYAIQEWIGLNKIEKIIGDYYNVVGFPMNKVYSILTGK